MRFYYDIKSEKGIMYTPSSFIIKSGDEEMEFDLDGTVDFDVNGGVIKGGLSVRTMTNYDFDEATEEHISKLKELAHKPHECTVYICPVNDDDNTKDDVIKLFDFDLYVQEELLLEETSAYVEIYD